MANLRSTHVAGDLSVSGNLKANLSIKIAGVTKTLDGSRVLEWTAEDLALLPATATEAGVVKLGSATVQTVAANAVSNTASRSYAVQVDANGKMVVNVPWVDADTVYTHPTGDGNKHVPATGTTSNGKFLMAGATAGSLSWANIPTATADADGVVKLGSSTKITAAVNTPSTTANRNYPIQLDSNGRMAVNVPWVDTNTVYTHPTSDGNKHVPATGTTNNGKFLMAGATAGSFAWADLPTATETVSGIVEKATTAEAIAGTANKFPDAAGVKAHIDSRTTQSLTDATAGRLLRVGDFGVGGVTDQFSGAHVPNGHMVSQTASGSDFPDGLLIKTAIRGDQSAGASFLLTLTGKGYSSSNPHNLMLEGYFYNNQIYSPRGINLTGSTIGQIHAFVFENRLCFWVPPTPYWNSFYATVQNTLGGDSRNYATELLSSVKPSDISKEVIVVLDKVHHTGNGATYTETQTGTENAKWISPAALSSRTATDARTGLVKLGSATVQTVAANGVSNTASRSYAIQADSNGKLVVNVPWVDTNTVYTHPTSDGNKHVPATGTTNNGKFLMAGATAGSLSWSALPTATETVSGIVEKATGAEALAGTANKFPDAAGVRSVIAQDAPSKTGTGASGTWGIDISGSASKLETAGYVVEYNPTTKSLDFNFVG